MVYDISPPLSPGTAVFPGDTPLSREVLLEIARGHNITLSTLRATAHLGAHADAPSHYGADGETIDRVPLDHYLGPCEVVEAGVARGARVRIDDLGWAGVESGGAATVRENLPARVLIRTGTQPDKGVFNPDFAGLDPGLVEGLADRGVVTIGVDTPSVDPADSKDLPAHRAFLRRGVAILEGLVLDGVPPGRYELIALPLRLVGFDASPVRAVLRTTRD